MVNGKREQTIAIISEWKSLLSQIELTERNIENLLKFIDFSYMYDSAVNLQILQGYLFNQENKSDFLDVVSNLYNNNSFIKEERKQLMELLERTPEEYLAYLLAPIRKKLALQNQALTQEQEAMFCEIMQVVGKINIKALHKLLATSSKAV